MEALFKKYFWLIKLAGVAIIVAFAASAFTTSMISRQALAPAGEDAMAKADKDSDEGETEGEGEGEDSSMSQSKMLEKLSTGVSNTGQQRKQRMVDSVVAGSIFCPTCTSPEVEAAVAASMPSIPGSLSSTAPPRPGEIASRLPLSLLATMESDDPAYSMATVLHTDSKALGAYSPTDELRPGVFVERIERGKLVFRNGAQVEYLVIGAVPPPPPPTAPTAPTLEEEKPANDREIEGAAEAISCDEAMTNCTVDKAFVEKLMANPAQLAKQARIVPAVADGETKGYKFYGIRPGSLPKLLGLKNGDLLTSVNGHELESLDQAMDLYNKLRRASHLSVSIERKGTLIQKEIDIK